jgi:potassium channel subfamily K
MRRHFPTWTSVKQDWHALATQFPLVAAILAPASVLFDIPALSQHWLNRDGFAVSDPNWNLILSAVGLGFNVLANALLVVRFSDTSRRVAVHATRLSAICWIIKTGIELGNIGAYVALVRAPVTDYQEGFWCAVVSLIVSGTIAFILGYHCEYFLLNICAAYSQPAGITRRGHVDSSEDKLEQRHFMLSILSFVSLLALEALVFSTLEHWPFFDGIYFATVSAFTIGFGDLVPTRLASRVLLFPFLVASIALLANQISMVRVSRTAYTHAPTPL